jgi:Spermidine synthase
VKSAGWINRIMASPVSMPERQVGRYGVRHAVYKAGSVMPVVTMRDAFLTGAKATSVKLADARIVHNLCFQSDDGSWSGPLMSDHPAEMKAMLDMADQARGRVLIGGLGLGIVANLAARKRSVSSVDVVEISPDVVDLVGATLDPKVKVHTADLYAFMDTAIWRWDVALFDTWYPTSEHAWISYVAPLRRIVRRRFGHRKVRCWAEATMWGQVLQALAGFTWAGVEPDRCWSDAYKAFRRATVDIWPVKPEIPDLSNQDFLGRFALLETEPFRTLAHEFIHDVGSPRWESRFGVHWPLVVPEGDA